jgi:hypothetical protein
MSTGIQTGQAVVTPNYALGRLPAVDARDAGFRMSQLLGPAEPLPEYKYWLSWNVLDQGQYPHCVAYAWSQYLRTGPIMQVPKLVEPQIYHEAQLVDEWPGEEYDGTSVRAGAKVLQKLGYIGAYTWAWDVETVIRHVLTRGPVVVGTNWYLSMFRPDSSGYIQIGGSLVGGHAYCITGYTRRNRAFRLINSWGYGWGQSGRAWIEEEDLARLISEDGEACAAEELRLVQP